MAEQMQILHYQFLGVYHRDAILQVQLIVRLACHQLRKRPAFLSASMSSKFKVIVTDR